MALNSSSIFLMIFPLLVTSLILNVFAVDGGRKGALAVGGWQPIKDPKDPLVQEIGKFAVTEHNKEAKTKLTYESVIKGETQVVAGTNYRLIILASDGINSGQYQAVVWDTPWDKPWEHFRKLTSFEKI